MLVPAAAACWQHWPMARPTAAQLRRAALRTLLTAAAAKKPLRKRPASAGRRGRGAFDRKRR
jgi:hypothetical protein